MSTWKCPIWCPIFLRQPSLLGFRGFPGCLKKKRVHKRRSRSWLADGFWWCHLSPPFLLADFRSPKSAFWSQRFKEIRPENSRSPPRFLDPNVYRGFETGCSEVEGLEHIATNKNWAGKGLKSRMLTWFWEDVIYLGSTPLPRIQSW